MDFHLQYMYFHLLLMDLRLLPITFTYYLILSSSTYGLSPTTYYFHLLPNTLPITFTFYLILYYLWYFTNYLWTFTNYLWTFTNYLWTFTNYLWFFTNYQWTFINYLWFFTNYQWTFTNYLWPFAKLCWDLASVIFCLVWDITWITATPYLLNTMVCR